jgi:cytochrome c oxidase cbb3-type subunit 3
MDVFQVVRDGVPDKGMPSWGRMLTPVELREAVAYVGTLRGKNLPGKAPQGNPIDTSRTQ